MAAAGAAGAELAGLVPSPAGTSTTVTTQSESELTASLPHATPGIHGGLARGWSNAAVQMKIAIVGTAAVAAGAATGVPLILPAPPVVLDLAGTWQLSGVQTTSNHVRNPPRFEGTRLVFAREGGNFRVVKGPEFLKGTVVFPEKVGERGILARSERTGRADCVDLRSGALVAKDVYAQVTSWEFKRTGSPGEDNNRPRRIEFHYLAVSDKDTDNPDAASCPAHAKFEASATAVPLSRN